MNIGRLSKRVTLYKFVDSEDELGQSIQKLSKVAEVWGDISPIRGSEFYEIKKIQSKVTHKCYIRWYEAYADINSNWFLKLDDKVFDIDSAIDVDYEHKMLEIRCYERVNKEGHAIEVPEPETEGTEEEETDG
jgi:SPP1 family predicted phage head-tail adaptor